MKAVLKKKSVAIPLMVVCIILAVRLGMNISFARQRGEIVQRYYNTGIQQELDRRIEAANSLVGLAEGQGVEESLIQQVKNDIESLRSATSPGDQFDANSVLSGSVAGLAEKTSGDETFMQNFQSAQQAIQQSDYNRQAEAYNEVRTTFPVSILRWALFSGPLEEFR